MARWWLLLVLAAVCLHARASNAIRVGGLFDLDDERQKAAFLDAVQNINNNRYLLPNVTLRAKMETVPPGDSFSASRQVCSVLRTGVAAIFGPQSEDTSAHVKSICDALEVPHIENRWNFRATRDVYSVNLFPHPSTLSRAYKDVLEALGWQKLCIIYENNNGLARVQELLKESKFTISLRQLPQTDDYRPMLQDVGKDGVTHIVLDVEGDKIYTVLKQAQQVGMMTSYYNYFITSLDLHTVELDEFRHGGTNVIALRMVDPQKPAVQRAIKNDKTFLKTEVVLMYDAVKLFAKGLTDLSKSQRITVTPLECDGDATWQHGLALINYIKVAEVNGLTGLIKLDTDGVRRDITLDIIQLTKEGLTRVGSWKPTMGANYTTTYNQVRPIAETLQQNKTLIISTVLSSPYTMLSESADTLTGNDRFEGFCVDLLEEVSRIVGFNYTIQLVEGDGNYGRWDEKLQKWTGMMGELLDQKADMTIGDLTITHERQKAVDFTMPWMNLGISILYKKPIRYPPNPFIFLAPWSLEVWLYLLMTYIGVSLLLFGLAKLSNPPIGCGLEDIKSLENKFSLNNSLWFTFGGFLHQNTDQHPKTISTRIVAGMWWLFTLIMLCFYIAALVAQLTAGSGTSPRLHYPIESAEDLARQTKIKYSTVYGGSTWNFFRNSKIPTYQRMFNVMESSGGYPSSNEEAVQRVQKSDGMYAHIMESTSIDYIVERICDLAQVGGLLDSKSYAFALPPGSPYTNAISQAILNLKERGMLHALQIKWWREKNVEGIGCVITKGTSTSSFTELGVSSVAGVFMVLLAGLGLATLVAVCEFAWKRWKVSKEELVT